MSKQNFEPKQLKTLIERRHPEYDEKLTHWAFLSSTYSGGRGWFSENIFKYVKEGRKEYKNRVQRAYRFNHTREVVNLVNKYIFKGEISRAEDAEEEVIKFWGKATREGLSVDQFMRQVDIKSSTFGRIWIAVDSTADSSVVSLKDQKRAGASVYAYVVQPQNVLDAAFDDDGKLIWILIYEEGRDDEDPFESTGGKVDRYRLWTRNKWFLIEKSAENSEADPKLAEEGENPLGEVPVFPVDCMGFGESNFSTPALINDIAYLDRAVANYLSNLDAIIQDQTFSQLAMPAQGLLPGEKGYNKLLEMGTKRIFTFDGEHGSAPFYLSPDPKQAQVILEVITKIITEIYHSVGVAGERTKTDNGMGIDNSSGVAKAYDFEKVNSLLSTKADALNRAENQLVRLVRLWNGIGVNEDAEQDASVRYPKTFDVRSLADEFTIAEQLAAAQAPDTVRREQMRILVEKLFPRLKKDLRAEIEKELKEYPVKAEMPNIQSSLTDRLKHSQQGLPSGDGEGDNPSKEAA